MPYIITDGEGMIYSDLDHPHILEEDEVEDTLKALAAEVEMSVDAFLARASVYDISSAIVNCDVTSRWATPPDRRRLEILMAAEAALEDDACGGCGAYHPISFYGDCRDDDNRYFDAEDYAIRNLGLEADS